MDEEWISITDAAARLTAAGSPVDRSTLSRYVAQHADALATKRQGKFTLVEFRALLAHRGENIRIDSVPAKIGSGVVRRFAGTQADGAARKASAEAEMREMDLAVRRRQLTPVGEVERAGRDAVALMQSAFDRAVDVDAAALALKYGWDERALRLALKQFGRHGIEVFHREVLQALDAMRRVKDAGDDPSDQAENERAGALQ